MPKKTLSGIELFELYLAEGGEYASVLQQAYLELGDNLFSMLEECEKTGKRITINEDAEEVIDSPITITIE